MELEEESPRHPNVSSPMPQGRAIGNVEVPKEEPSQEAAQPPCNHGPHVLEDLQVLLIFSLLCDFRRVAGKLQGAKPWPQEHLHYVYSSEKYHNRQNCIASLVEYRVL